MMHVALRAPVTTRLFVDGQDVIPDVHRVLDAIDEFSSDIRAGRRVGVTGKKLTTVISIGIGGSYLGDRKSLRYLTVPSIACIVICRPGVCV